MATFWLGLLFGLLMIVVVTPLFSDHTWQIDEERSEHVDLYAK